MTEHGDLQRAIGYAKELTRLSEVTPEDKIAYSQMHLVFELIASMNEEEPDKTTLKIEIETKKTSDKSSVLSPIMFNLTQNS